MNSGVKSILLLTSVIFLTSCDAVLFMTYTVENKSQEAVTIFVPDYPTDSTFNSHGFGRTTDTTLSIKAGETLLVGIGSKIDFPWGTKNIYRNQPGICGIEIHRADSIQSLGCSTSEWKYRRRNSNLKLK